MQWFRLGSFFKRSFWTQGPVDQTPWIRIKQKDNTPVVLVSGRYRTLRSNPNQFRERSRDQSFFALSMVFLRVEYHKASLPRRKLIRKALWSTAEAIRTSFLEPCFVTGSCGETISKMCWDEHQNRFPTSKIFFVAQDGWGKEVLIPYNRPIGAVWTGTRL